MEVCVKMIKASMLPFAILRRGAKRRKAGRNKTFLWFAPTSTNSNHSNCIYRYRTYITNFGIPNHALGAIEDPADSREYFRHERFQMSCTIGSAENAGFTRITYCSFANPILPTVSKTVGSRSTRPQFQLLFSDVSHLVFVCFDVLELLKLSSTRYELVVHKTSVAQSFVEGGQNDLPKRK
eukprot:2485273-Amphidinium_carterae.1